MCQTSFLLYFKTKFILKSLFPFFYFYSPYFSPPCHICLNQNLNITVSLCTSYPSRVHQLYLWSQDRKSPISENNAVSTLYLKGTSYLSPILQIWLRWNLIKKALLNISSMCYIQLKLQTELQNHFIVPWDEDALASSKFCLVSELLLSHTARQVSLALVLTSHSNDGELLIWKKWTHYR